MEAVKNTNQHMILQQMTKFLSIIFYILLFFMLGHWHWQSFLFHSGIGIVTLTVAFVTIQDHIKVPLNSMNRNWDVGKLQVIVPSQ